jgi:hypothetical protein
MNLKRSMSKQLLTMGLLLTLSFGMAQAANRVQLVENASGIRLQVDGKDLIVNGMNWDYFPIGTNYSYSLWNQPDDIIQQALDDEMSLLRGMGVNAIRVYTGIPKKWIQYIYEKYGIYTMLNHSFGRYGLSLDGAWVANTEYSDPRVKKLLLSEVKEITEDYKDTPGLLLYLLGNENNYGLFWGGAETEDIPMEDRKSTIRARHMYKLFNEASLEMKAIDKSHPVALCNGDLLFLDIIAEECPDVDIFGTNVYRGVSFGDLFDRVKKEYGKPVLFTEFGSDAFNAISGQEDQNAQAYYLIGNWREIYENAAGLGKAGNSLGGFTFQFSDGWWKYGQTINLDVQDNNASWANGGYQFDFLQGENNMNEEWFGICAKGPTDNRGLYQLYPRAAYYALQEAHSLNPFGAGITLQTIQRHFAKISPMTMALKARGDKAILDVAKIRKLWVKGARLNFATYSTGGTQVETPEQSARDYDAYPSFQGFDQLQSFYLDFGFRPTGNFYGAVSLNILGNVPENPIDEIFFENRGRAVTVKTDDGTARIADIERVKVYRANFTWEDRWFTMQGFYRTGHYHWGYEGDFFGLYPEANYGPNIDTYNGNAPLGVEISGKKALSGLKLAYGPELWWGANPAVLLKYSKKLGALTTTAIYQEDLDEQGSAVSSFAIPLPPTRKATLHLDLEMGPLGLELGGIWSGDNKIGDGFQVTDGEAGSYVVLQDYIKEDDTYGGKAKLTFSKGRFNWYAESAAMGLVADGRPNGALTFTGWRLKDSGSGNQVNFLSGFALTLGNFQFAPNFLWQKPIVGPMPVDAPAPGRLRNYLSDPFAVRGNRETTAGELLINFDPTPATWLFAWDNDIQEDAKFAGTLGFIYREHPTSQDAAIGIMADGRTIFAFPSAPPARDLWEAYARIISKVNPRFGLIMNLYGGEAEPNGDDERLITRYGGDIRMVMGSLKLIGEAKFNDWGPYDYHRDFNLTYPLQIAADLSKVLGKPGWLDNSQPRFGIRAAWRSLDDYSPRYMPEAGANPADGSEWEIRTYFDLNIGM